MQQALEDFNTTVDNDPRVRDALAVWQDCMEAAGHPFANRDDMMAAYDYDETADLQTQFAESEAWDPTSPDHARWQELVDLEVQIAVADATCTPPFDEAREAVVADLRPQFAQVWQTVDWSLPPVTYPDDLPPGAVIDPQDGETTATTDAAAATPTTEPGVDLSDPTGNAAPTTAG